MKPEVEAALRRAAKFRRGVLRQLSTADRLRLLEDLFVDFFVVQWRVLLKWAALTGQSSQVDTGYIAQHVASILLAEPGQGFKGKGLDLLDESEVKSAAIVSGVDRPRWNHDLGRSRTTTSDGRRTSERSPRASCHPRMSSTSCSIVSSLTRRGRHRWYCVFVAGVSTPSKTQRGVSSSSGSSSRGKDGSTTSSFTRRSARTTTSSSTSSATSTSAT